MSKHDLFLLAPSLALSMGVVSACTADLEDGIDDLQDRDSRTYASAVAAIGEGNELCGHDSAGRRSCLSIDRTDPVRSSTPYHPDDDLELCAYVDGQLEGCGDPPYGEYTCDRTNTYCGCTDDWVDCVNLLLDCDDHGTCDPYACPDGGDYACCCTIATE